MRSRTPDHWRSPEERTAEGDFAAGAGATAPVEVRVEFPESSTRR